MQIGTIHMCEKHLEFIYMINLSGKMFQLIIYKLLKMHKHIIVWHVYCASIRVTY